ncbi:hypothetical protein [Streptomyces sp. NPDC002491]
MAAMHLLVTASWALPTFTAARGHEHALPPIHRSHGRPGSDRPTLVYVPAYHPSIASDGGDFPRFHRAFQDGPDALDVLEFPPGSAPAPPYRRTVPRWPARRPRTYCGTSGPLPS